MEKTERQKKMSIFVTTQTSHFIFKALAIGGGGHIQLIQKVMKTLTFRSLCFPESFKARGVDNVDELPTYFYRDDGLKVWEATKRSGSTCFYRDDCLRKSVPCLLNHV